jgi:hypothetical protein
VVADFHYIAEEQDPDPDPDPHYDEMSDPDPQSNEKLDTDPDFIEKPNAIRIKGCGSAILCKCMLIF